MPLSRHPVLPWVSTFFGTVCFGFGVAYVFYPRPAFATFGFPYPETPADLELMDAVIRLFGMKDLFVGFAIWMATWGGSRKLAGAMLTAGSVCATVDGYVVKSVAGTGEWNHWGYGSVMGMLGLVIMGILG